jgi:hypothetical protein
MHLAKTNRQQHWIQRVLALMSEGIKIKNDPQFASTLSLNQQAVEECYLNNSLI